MKTSSESTRIKLNDTQIRASKPRPKDYKLSDRRGLAHKGSCRFVPAEVRGGDVRLSGNGPGATRVRYCWGAAPVCNLYDGAGLPAGPFDMATEGAN